MANNRLLVLTFKNPFLFLSIIRGLLLSLSKSSEREGEEGEDDSEGHHSEGGPRVPDDADDGYHTRARGVAWKDQ